MSTIRIFIVDDNFIGNKAKIKKEILPAIIEWMKAHDYPFWFITEVSINLADDKELMELMREAGFIHVFVGIETPAEESLKECNKFANLKRDLIASVKRSKIMECRSVAVLLWVLTVIPLLFSSSR